MQLAKHVLKIEKLYKIINLKKILLKYVYTPLLAIIIYTDYFY